MSLFPSRQCKTLLFAAACLALQTPARPAESPPVPIDRHALVSRHDIVWPSLTGEIPLGNGNFAFNADGTGLETFGGNTMSHWCWHSFPLPAGTTENDVKPWAALEHGRLTGPTTQPPLLKDWLYFNPHPLNLGRLGFIDAQGRRIDLADCVSTGRQLDLWSGLLTSRFTYRGQPVEVETCVDHERDLVAVRVSSPLLRRGELRIRLDFPSPSAPNTTDPRTTPKPWVGDFANLANHCTDLVDRAPNRLDIERTVNSTIYRVQLSGRGVENPARPVPLQIVSARYGAPGQGDKDVTAILRMLDHGDVTVSNALFGDPAPGVAKRLEVVYRLDGVEQTESIPEGRIWALPGAVSPNRIDLDTAGSDTFELACFFSAGPPAAAPLPSFADTRASCAAGWQKFWQSGGAIDLSGSKDPRWMELERRIVLSQYELAVQSAGDQFPAEVGLTGYDMWCGKFHLEMTWWHLAHYALWDRWPMAQKALGYYRRNAPNARAIADNFGYKGLMWPKSTGPNGINDGYPPEMALMWKQPHPIFFAELEYRLHPTRETLEKWQDLVLGTAEMMADYPTLDPQTGVYSIVPCWPACESPVCKDPIFELGYWRWALLAAQQWRERLGLPREAHWDEVVAHLAPLPVQNGLYVYRADRTDTYTRRQFDHFDQIGIFAMIPPFPGIDRETAHRTVLEVARGWNWDMTWGWDFPYLAMGAAKVGEPAIALDALFNPSLKNGYDERGICAGMGPGTTYLPGNGGLLYAAAMMAAGWDGAPDRPAPGFPADGSWTVRWEGLKPAP